MKQVSYYTPPPPQPACAYQCTQLLRQNSVPLNTWDAFMVMNGVSNGCHTSKHADISFMEFGQVP